MLDENENEDTQNLLLQNLGWAIYSAMEESEEEIFELLIKMGASIPVPSKEKTKNLKDSLSSSIFTNLLKDTHDYSFLIEATIDLLVLIVNKPKNPCPKTWDEIFAENKIANKYWEALSQLVPRFKLHIDALGKTNIAKVKILFDYFARCYQASLYDEKIAIIAEACKDPVLNHHTNLEFWQSFRLNTDTVDHLIKLQRIMQEFNPEKTVSLKANKTSLQGSTINRS